jgi:uncharacterized protein DUF2501
MIRSKPAVLFAILGAVATVASAQMPSLPGLGGLGGMPNISGMGVGNAAGVLGYCTKNKLLGSSSGASSVLGALQKKPGVTSSKGFAAGQAGQILAGGSSSFSLDSVSGPMKSQACDMVLKQARHFL